MTSIASGVNLFLVPVSGVNFNFHIKMQLNRFHLRQTVVAAALVLAAHAALAVDPFTVRDIRVEGLQRVEPGTIFASIPVRVGDTWAARTPAAFFPAAARAQPTR